MRYSLLKVLEMGVALADYNLIGRNDIFPVRTVKIVYLPGDFRQLALGV